MKTPSTPTDSQPRSRGRASNEVRPTASGILSIGNVTVRFQAFTAASAITSLSSSMVHKGCGSRMKQQMICLADGGVVAWADRVKVLEHEGKEVELTECELKSLNGPRHERIDVLELVPADTIDVVYIKKTYYLGPGPQADRHFKLLAVTMAEANRIAVGRWGTDDQLVFVRPYKEGLLLHEAYYAPEVRNFDVTDPAVDYLFSPGELGVARDLIQQLSRTRFEPEKYQNAYDERLRSAVERKAAGEVIAPDAEVAELAKTTPKKKRSKKVG